MLIKKIVTGFLIIFIRQINFNKKKLKKLSNENFRKQFKTNHNFLTIVSCIDNANINKPLKMSCIYLWSFVLELHLKPKFILPKTDFA